MTSQTKTFIELSDIIGLGLECKTCGCSLAIGAEKEGRTVDDSLFQMNSVTLIRCPTCGVVWMEAPDRNRLADTELKELARKSAIP